MLSTRNKRKRAETDSSRSTGRPKSREQRDAAAPSGKKNEGPKAAANTNDASKANSGTSKELDSSTVATRQQQTIAQDASLKTRSVPTGNTSLPTASNHSSRQKGSLSPNNTSASNPLHSREFPSATDSLKGEVVQEAGKGRSARLQGLIAHRSSLRTRIRYCAAAASERLREEIGKSSDSNLDLSNLKPADDDEVSLFLQMTNSATMAAKRIRSECEANSDRRTSLSLRRGSSVGKRMNAALSSLAPGSSTSQPPSNLSTAETNKKVTLTEEEKQAVGIIKVENKQMQSTLPVQPTLPPSNSLVQHTISANVHSNSIPSQRRQSKQDKQHGTEAKLIHGNSNIDGKGPAPNSKFSDIQMKSNRQSSSIDANRLALPMHLRVVTESLPQNKLSGRSMFASKTTVLRKQRDAIEARLKSHREQTRQKAMGLSAKNNSFQHRPLQRRKTVYLPRRKMTHWDALLQEMSWMATDFIEERKWKESASRNISSAVVRPSEMFSNPTRLPFDEIIDVTSLNNSKQHAHKSTQPGTGTGKKIESFPSCTKLKETAIQTYPANSLHCEEAAREVGRNIALMITKLGTAVMGTIEKKEFHLHENHTMTYQNMRNPRDVSRSKDQLRLLSLKGGLRATKSGQKTFSFLEISRRIDSFEKTKEQRNRGPSKRDSSNSGSLSKIRLSKEQKDVIDRVTNMWNQPIAPGIALSGTPFCGKTHTASFLMWRRRKHGPQLLLCPTNSITRWKHEIEQFGDIRVLSYGLLGPLGDHLSEGRAISPKAGDIIVCEFKLLDHIAGFFDKSYKSTNSFGKIVVDCRHSSSLYSSLDKTTPETMQSNSVRLFDGSEELESTFWWDKLLDLSLHVNTAVLLIERTAGNNVFHMHSNLSPKMKLEIAASRAALLIGPRFFLCDGERIQRRVLSWALHHGKLEGRRKTAEAGEAIEKGTTCLTISLPSPGWSIEKMRWELRRCKMGDIQRSKYDACCIQVRGALSCRLTELVARSGDALDSVSSSLMRLRKQCIHADTKGERVHSMISMKTRKIENPAQLDSALAFSLIKGSAKLRELISILRFKCDVSIAGNLVVACDLLDQKIEASTSSPRKVAILATLPIAQEMVSLLLNALGVQHQLLQSTCSECSQKSLSAIDSHTRASVFCSQCQHVLPCFDGMRRRGCSSRLLTDIIVASPMCLSGWNRGRGVENADTVILLDEDWTGRGEFALSVLMSRIQAHNFHTGKRCDFIRLICEDTIEENLFSSVTPEYAFVESNRWPRDKSGFVTFPESQVEALNFNKTTSKPNIREASGFPLFRVTRLRHKLLSNTLLPLRTIPLELVSASKIQFLPFAHVDGKIDDIEIKSEVELIKVLCHEESVASARYIFEANAGDRWTGSNNRLLFLVASHKTGVFRPFVTKQEKLLVCSYLKNLFASNLEHFESTPAPGLRITHVSFDQPRLATAVSAPHPSSGGKSITSRNTLFRSTAITNNLFSGRSILHYAPLRERDQQQEVNQQCCSCYSNLYASIHVNSETCAGYEGFEPLLFFPPFLNGEIRRGAFNTFQTSSPEIKKRKGASFPPYELPISKRVRQTELSLSIMSQNEDYPKASLGSKVVNINSKMDVQHQTFTQHSSSLLKDTEPPEISNRYARGSENNVHSATPSRSDLTASRQKTVVPRECRVYPFSDNSEIYENIHQHYSGRSNSFLDSVILFVKKAKMQNMGVIGVSGLDSKITKQPVDTQIPTLAPFGGDNFAGKEGEDSEKRNKKKMHEKFAVQAASVHSSGQAPTTQATDALKKLGHRHRLHEFFVSRLLASGLSMFESVPYQAVVSQVEARVAKAIEKQQSYLGGERGIFAPHQQLEIGVSKTQSGHRNHAGWELLGDKKDDIKLLGERYIKKFNSIGPRGGFLSSFKGTNAPTIQKQQLGVSLPMGVKVSQAREELHSAWSRNVNSLLCDMVNRYGQNWILIAKMMQHILKSEIGKNQYYETRESLWWKSADHCQRRWESICETDESESRTRNIVGCERRLMSIRQDGSQQEMRWAPYRSVWRATDSPVLVGRTCMVAALDRSKYGNGSDQAVGGEIQVDGHNKASQRNSSLVFSSLITSNVQRRMMPIAIIGVGSGPKQNQATHSHPSHLQSVQESVTSHWSDGRTELWPLQILDAAEKHYAAARAPSAPAKPGTHPHVSASTSPLPGRGHGHPYSRVPGNATTSTQPVPKSAQPPRMSGQNNMSSAPRASIAPKKTIPHNGLARSTGKNSRSK